MKIHLRLLAGAALGMAALSLTSCYYDPYYGGGSSVSASYSSGYGDGYGYGSPSFSSSVFVVTGDPRWGYDPYCYSYYDYSSRRYYDPYLDGYYPVGYRPPVVYGVPHPYGWRPGSGYCPPPRNYRNVTVVNYRNRVSAYQNTNYGWARQVRQQPIEQGRVMGRRPSQDYNERPNTGFRPSSDRDRRPSTGSRPSSDRDWRPDSGSRPQSGNFGSAGNFSSNRTPASNGNFGSNYIPREAEGRPASRSRRDNTPVSDGRQEARQQARPNGGFSGDRVEGNRPQQKQSQRKEESRPKKNEKDDDQRIRGERF